MTRIVELHDKDPLVIRKDELEDDVYICRCGLSADWPYCDSSHAKARREPEGLHRYTRKDGELVRSDAGIEPGAADPRAD